MSIGKCHRQSDEEQISNTQQLVGWEINVPFQHKNRLYCGQCLGWIFS